MLRVTRSSSFIGLCLSLSALAFSQSLPGSAPQLLYSQTQVEWPAAVPDAGLLLTVSGPRGLYVRHEHPAGNWASFSLIDEQGQPRPDGVYKWELVAQAGWEVKDQPTASGWFQITGGRVVAEELGDDQPVVVEQTAPPNSLYVDDKGRVGIGTSVPGAQLHLKGAAPAMAFEDTRAGGREYRLRSKEGGDGSLGLFDEVSGKARWMVDGEGRMGINTTNPTSTLTVDGYIEATKGFLVNGKPLGGFSLLGASRPLYLEGPSNSFFGTNAGNASLTGTFNSYFGVDAGKATTSGAGNTFVGWGAGSSITNGNDNSFFGAGAGLLNTASNNSFFGQNAGVNNTTGSGNAFFGRHTGSSNTLGINNSLFGAQAGASNTTGGANSFFGTEAGLRNTTGSGNSFFGRRAGLSNTTGNSNSFFGWDAGSLNTTGTDNVFFGDGAGYSNNGNYNSFFGAGSGGYNQTGTYNCFLGAETGYNNTVEHFNTLVGSKADLDPGPAPTTNPVTNATAIGYRSYVSRSNSLVLGAVNGFNGATNETLVGIGTTAPDRQLVVEGSQAIGKFRRFNATGPGFGPAFLFERARGTNTAPLDIMAGDYLGKVQFRGRVGENMPEYGALVFIASDTSQNGRFAFVDRDLATERMVILNSGNVGIGTRTPSALLDVAGDLRVRGTILYGAPAAPVPDYVFAPHYKLMPLIELDQYVRTERHLPNVPNASDIQQKGVNLGEFQLKLLEKIEELTLYTIQQERADARLREEAAALRQKTASQEDRIKALEEAVKALMEREKGGR